MSAALPGCRTARRSAARVFPMLSVAAVLAVLALLAIHLGADAFVDGLRLLDLGTVLAAIVLTAAATLAASWRWSVIAHALGDPLPLRTAVQEYYRSQLMNLVLPGGVLGDVHRAIAPAAGRTQRALRLRAVAWDRGSGQAVQAALLTVALLLALPDRWPIAAGVGAALFLGLVALRFGRGQPARGRIGRRLRVVQADAAVLQRRRGTMAAVLAASLVVTLSHALIFVLAALATGTRAAPLLVLLVALAVQAATVVPVGLGGWGVREGAAAALFAASGLDAAHGVSAAVATGALALVAVLPGVLPLVLRRPRGLPRPARQER